MWDSGKHWKITFIIAWGESGNITVIWWQHETDAATVKIQAQRTNSALECPVTNHSHPHSSQSLPMKKTMDKVTGWGSSSGTSSFCRIRGKKRMLRFFWFREPSGLKSDFLRTGRRDVGFRPAAEVRVWGRVRENKEVWSHTKQVCHRTKLTSLLVRWKRHETLA